MLYSEYRGSLFCLLVSKFTLPVQFSLKLLYKSVQTKNDASDSNDVVQPFNSLEYENKGCHASAYQDTAEN